MFLFKKTILVKTKIDLIIKMDEIRTIKEVVICRDKQIDFLAGLIRESPFILPNSLFIYGLSGTGKSLVVSSLLKFRKIKACYINCIEFYSQRVIYESILNQITDTYPSKENGYQSISSDNFAEFLHLFKKNINSQLRYALVFDNAERLRLHDAKLFSALCRLQEFSNSMNIVVIFMSRLPLDKFRGSMGFIEPLVVHFPQYSKDELAKILLVDKPSSVILSDEGYKNYINLVLSIFFIATRDLTELKHLLHINISSYMDPILKGEANEMDLRLLWRNIEPKLKQALATVYLRQISSDQFMKMQSLTDTAITEAGLKQSSTIKLDLPFYSKFLLIAAYLASYNPTKTDRRYFTKNHGKKRKTQAMIKAKQRSCSQLVGPRPFPLDRLLAIFYSIIEDKVSPTSQIFSQISALLSLRLLTSIGTEDSLAAPKYKSNVSLDFIKSIAKFVNK